MGRVLFVGVPQHSECRYFGRAGYIRSSGSAFYGSTEWILLEFIFEARQRHGFDRPEITHFDYSRLAFAAILKFIAGRSLILDLHYVLLEQKYCVHPEWE